MSENEISAVLDDLLAIIDSEEEFDGEPPAEMATFLMNSPPIEVLRATVRVTKKNIRERIAAFSQILNGPDLTRAKADAIKAAGKAEASEKEESK